VARATTQLERTCAHLKAQAATTRTGA
jgi:hypothetical protein